MNTLLATQSLPESQPPKFPRPPGHRNLFKVLFAALVTATSASLLPAQTPTLQPAGDVILDVRSIDLDPANTIWTNVSTDPLTVGNLHTQNGSTANVTTLPYTDAIVGSTNANVLFVASSGGNSMLSTTLAPAQILGHGSVSAEVWVQATDVGTSGATITSATVAYGDERASAHEAQRDFNYSVGNGNGAVSGFFDDSNWTPQTFPTAGVWHYLVYTYDGTNFRAYQDGVLNTTANKAAWNTLAAPLCVGSDGFTGGGDPFHGYIAAARVMTGVLTASQILNNFNAGLYADYGIIALTPTAAPTTNAFLGDTITLSETALANQALTFQWQTDNGSSGATFSNIGGATTTNYVLNTGTLTAGSYEYEVVATGNTSVTSAPVIIKVNPPSKPILSQNITPATTSNLFVGSSVTFSASFIGNQTISNQWQISTNGGASFADLPGDTNTTLPLLDLQLNQTGLYRLVATNAFGGAASSAASVNVQPLSALPTLQVAGQLLVQLEPGDLNTNGTTWTNEINGIGDFTTSGGLNLSVTNLTYDFQPINALSVGGTNGDAVTSAQPVPTSIAGNGTASVEAWVVATTLVNNNTVEAYGVQGGSGAQKEDREMDYGGNSALSGDFGNLDASWATGTQTANAWHYLAWVYDGTNYHCYQDGVLNFNKNGVNPLPTVQTVCVVGGGIANSGPGLTDAFHGNIATVRVESGVLSASQVLNNYIAGPFQKVQIVLSTPTISPSNVVFYGDSVEVSVTNAQSLQNLTYQWQSDNGTGGATFSNVSGQTDTNYSFSTTTLPRTVSAANYEYQLVATGSLGTVVTSAPVTLTVKPAAPPTILADTSPSSLILFVGQQGSFSAAFSGNQPITNQWQISTNHGLTFVDMAGDTNGSVTVTNVQLTDAAQYRLVGTNAFGHTNSTPAKLFVLPLSAAPTVQFAGEVIADLESSDLDVTNGLWHNESTAADSVGDFTYAGAGPLNETNTTYNGQTLNVLNVAGVSGNSVEALNVQAPAILLGANPCTMEAWVFATDVSGGNTVVNYGDQSSQSGDLDRALNYQTQGYGAFTGYFGDADLGWNPTATANVWHHIAVTYDGSNLIVYQDGVANGSHSGITLKTDETYISVGSGTGGGPFAGANQLAGMVASARVETGVLTPAQVLSNYHAGPAPGLATGLNIAQLAPLTSSFSSGHLTLSWLAGTLQEATSATGPWTTDNNATSPMTVTPATAGAPIKFYRLQY